MSLSIPFFGEDDLERIAYYTWQWDHDNGITTRSYESVKGLYRDRAAYVVEGLNRRMCTA